MQEMRPETVHSLQEVRAVSPGLQKPPSRKKDAAGKIRRARSGSRFEYMEGGVGSSASVLGGYSTNPSAEKGEEEEERESAGSSAQGPMTSRTMDHRGKGERVHSYEKLVLGMQGSLNLLFDQLKLVKEENTMLKNEILMQREDNA